ncbi:MAG TPA: SlyX family protein [Desulfuromonadales bacterium]|nr:SlyX family protein [Desulfuromonadales bacterium]
MKELQERLNELEIRFTHQARLIDELNSEIVACNQRLSRLERENRSFREMLQNLAPTLTESPDE